MSEQVLCPDKLFFKEKTTKIQFFFTLNPVPCAEGKQGELHTNKHLLHWKEDAISSSFARSPPTGKEQAKSWCLDSLQVEEQSNPPIFLIVSK